MPRIFFINPPAGDGGGGGGTAEIVEVVVDFGSTPVKQATFVVAVAGALTSQQVIVTQTMIAATGRSRDENEMDALVCRGYVSASGQVTIHVSADPGPVHGEYVLAVLVG